MGVNMTEKGLADVVAAQTSLSDIDGALGRLWYVGYDIHDLAKHSTFEETSYLLHHGSLPNAVELKDWNDQLIAERDISKFRAKLMETLAVKTSPMSMLRTGVSAASAYDPDGWDESPEAQLRKATRLISTTSTLIAMYHRMREGKEIVEASPTLSHAANFLWTMLGVEPSEHAARVLDVTLILYADHTMNASTFTARVIASTLSDMFSAVTGAIAALKGPLHGGANEEAMKVLEEVGRPENAAAFVAGKLERHELIMGFGHRVYKTEDPRATVLREMSRSLGEEVGDSSWYDISRAIELEVLEQRGLYPNVDFYAASVYHYLGIPTDLMTPIFALARMAGWTAHIREQYADNRIMRPDSDYLGPRDLTYVPIEERP
jgi:citrate synthase